MGQDGQSRRAAAETAALSGMLRLIFHLFRECFFQIFHLTVDAWHKGSQGRDRECLMISPLSPAPTIDQR